MDLFMSNEMTTGTKLICIANIRSAYMVEPRLYVDKIYTIKSYSIVHYFRKDINYVELEEHPHHRYDIKCFITLKEIRNLKLKKLKNNEKI